MQALRQEALQTVNNMPDYLMKALLENLKHFKFRQIDSFEKDLVGKEIDPKKTEVFASMEEWRYRKRNVKDFTASEIPAVIPAEMIEIICNS